MYSEAVLRFREARSAGSPTASGSGSKKIAIECLHLPDLFITQCEFELRWAADQRFRSHSKAPGAATMRLRVMDILSFPVTGSGPRSWPQLWLFSTPLQSALTSSKFFRKKLDLFANIRPARTYPGVKSRFDPFDRKRLFATLLRLA